MSKLLDGVCGNSPARRAGFGKGGRDVHPNSSGPSRGIVPAVPGFPEPYLDGESRREFVTLIRRNTHLFAIQNADLVVEPPCRDPRDNLFLALALAAEADALVSSDEDLLILHPWRGIAIVTPAEFLSQSNASPEIKTYDPK